VFCSGRVKIRELVELEGRIAALEDQAGLGGGA
jgi:hypothetical protein